MRSMEQQANLYSYINQSTAMQFLAPQLFAQQPLMSSWSFHPALFGTWPHLTPLPYISPNAEFIPSNLSPSSVDHKYFQASLQNNNESGENQTQISKLSPSSMSNSPGSQMNDSVETRKVFDTKSPANNKIFKCNTCNKTFGYKHVLQNHMKVHTGEKSYGCPICPKFFRRDHHLKVHLRQHSGEKPYSCTLCDHQFVQVANLRRHLKSHENSKLLKIQPKSIKSDAKVSFNSESSEESLELRRPLMIEHYDTSTGERYESLEQSEPEDLSTKGFARLKEKYFRRV